MTDTPEYQPTPRDPRSDDPDERDQSAVNGSTEARNAAPDPSNPTAPNPTAPYGSNPEAATRPMPRYGEHVPAQQAPRYGEHVPGQPTPPYTGQAPTGPTYSANASGVYGAAPQPTYPAAAGGAPSPTGSTPESGGSRPGGRRSGRVGVVAALAIGAIVGGIAGAGVFALADGSDDSTQVSTTANTPANITVNDAADATPVTAVAATAGPSIVTLSVGDATTGSAGTGSGVIISEDGYVITNTHVVTLDGAAADSTVSVQTADGRLFTGTVVGTDPIVDLAVVKIEGADDLQPIEFADSSELNVGDAAVAIGAPLGLANTVTDGIVSALNRSITVASSAAPESSDDESSGDPGQQGPFDFWQLPGQESTPTTATATISLPVIQTDAAINPGNSGGALLDSDGALIGINVAIASAGSSSGASASGSIGVGFAIPSNLAKRVSAEIIENGTGTHGLLGANVSDVTPEDAAVVGAMIERVSDDGAAAAAGIEAGDVVTSIGGVPVTGATDLTAQVRALAAGATADVIYVRDGDTRTTEVTLGTLQ